MEADTCLEAGVLVDGGAQDEEHLQVRAEEGVFRAEVATQGQGWVGTGVALSQTLQSSFLPWAICHSSGENFQLFLWIVYFLL